MEPVIRPATSDEDKAAVYRFRYELYVESQGLFQDEADHERRWLTDGYDGQAHIFLAEDGGRVVGTARLLLGADAPFTDASREEYDMDRFRDVVDERGIAVGTRLLVREEYRGGPLAFHLIARTFELAAQRDVELFLCTCEVHLVSHYLKYGYRPYGQLMNHPTNGVLVRVGVVMGDFDHLRKIGSPMLEPLGRRTNPARAAEELVPLMVEDTAVRSKEMEETVEYWGDIASLLSQDEDVRHFLGDLTQVEASVLLAKSHLLMCQPGDALIRKGHVSRTLYVLLVGALEVRDEGKLVAVVREPGTVLGEVAFFTSGKRMSDVVAGAQGAHVLSLNNSTLRELIASHGTLAAKFLLYITRGLCAKLQHRGSADNS